MVFLNSKALFMGGVLTLALRPGVLGNRNDASSWMQSARKLQANKFFEVCDEVFMSPDHMQQHSYLMSDFAEEVTALCHKIAPNPDQGTCETHDFNGLDSSLQEAFFQHASQHMGDKAMPIEMMMEWGNAGYIVSNKTAIEQDVMRKDLCVEIREAIGDEFLQQIPVSDLPIHPDLPEDNQETDDISIINVEKEEGQMLSISAIIAISCLVAAVIAFFFYREARRRNRARINRMPRFGNRNKGVEDGAIRVNTSSSKKKFKPFRSRSSRPHPVEEIKAAINEADWDSVYRLASQVAQNDDGLSLPTFGFRDQERSHLDAEDQERAKTLYKLSGDGDWTGLAVTAALYAGETSGSPVAKSEEYYPDESVTAAENDDVEEQNSMKRMVSGLSKALNAGNWQQVTKFANLIKEEKNAGSSFDTDSLSIPSSSSSVSSDTSNTELSKKQTIAKLMRAGKWKGVSIMANMYEMESKQHAQPSSSMRPYPPSPNHPYSDTRSILRTKELRHSDRVQENIVGFRGDP